MFRRATTFDTAYVGSSNLSRAALLDGVEWNVRLSRVGTAGVAREVPRQPSTPTGTTRASRPTTQTIDRDRLDDALAEASGRTTHERVTLSLSGLEVRPFPYQQTMLDALEVERRVHDHHHNLVVAATGTGKTVVAALDYRRLSESAGERPVAAVRGASTGDPRAIAADLPRGAQRRELRRAVRRWGTPRTLAPRVRQRAVADCLRRRPASILRHTTSWSSTSFTTPRRRHTDGCSIIWNRASCSDSPPHPERTDGLDVRSFFDGRTAAELRLWDALGRRPAVPVPLLRDRGWH